MTDRTMSLDGKRVIVIGGTSGIGFAIAALSRELGAEVVIASSNAKKVEAAIPCLNGAIGRIVDLRDEASVSRLFETIGRFDHLAITAGDWDGAMFGPTPDLDFTAARDRLEVRFWGVLAAVKHASHGIARNGSITLTGGMPSPEQGRGACSGDRRRNRTSRARLCNRSRARASQCRLSRPRPHRACKADAGREIEGLRGGAACSARRIASRGRDALRLFDAQLLRHRTGCSCGRRWTTRVKGRGQKIVADHLLLLGIIASCDNTNATAADSARHQTKQVRSKSLLLGSTSVFGA